MSTMRQQSRYQIGNLLGEEAGVKIYMGLDPLTGLPVRCYEFSGTAISDAEFLSSPHIPDILASCAQESQVWVFTSDLANCKIVQPQITVKQSEAFLLDTAQALNDAAQLNIIHGRICPQRFLSDGAQYYIEGYGVRWEKVVSTYYPDTQSLEGDIYAWAVSVKELVGNTLPKQVNAIINLCLAKPSDRPNAQTLLEKLSSAYFYLTDNSDGKLSSQVEENTTPPLKEKKDLSSSYKAKPTRTPSDDSDSKKQETKGNIVNTTPKSAGDNDTRTADLTSQLSGDVESNKLLLEAKDSTEPPPLSTETIEPKPAANENELSHESVKQVQDLEETSFDNDNDLVEKDSPITTTITLDSKKSWVETLLEQKQQEVESIKSLSASVKTQEVEDIGFEEDSNENLQMTAISGIYGTKERSRKNLSLGIIILIIGVLAATAVTLYFFFSEEKSSLPLPVTVNPKPGTRYIIYPEFPTDLRLVELVVISSPQGSSYLPNSSLGTLTSSGQPIFLDKEGKWQLQARFDEHLSNIVEATVPLNNSQSGLVFEFQ